MPPRREPTDIGAAEIDWSLIRLFLAVVDAGSLTGAAAMMGTSQPTLSRKIEEIEQRIGSSLFERAARGLRLTDAGAALLEPARQMKLAAEALTLTAMTHTQEMAGTVRLTASEMTASYLLPELIAALRRRYPEIQIEVVVSNHMENLLERQADIALRHARPTQSGLVTRRIGDLRIEAYARRDYMDSVGGVIDVQRMQGYNWIGYDNSDSLLRGFRDRGMNVDRSFFCIRCDNHIMGWQLALAGAGICLAPRIVGERWPEMQSVLPPTSMPSIPLWLTAHREVRNSKRVKAVFDMLAEGLREMLGDPPADIDA